jgi:LmbE family N-acetylglucosaminyl deacetylase
MTFRSPSVSICVHPWLKFLPAAILAFAPVAAFAADATAPASPAPATATISEALLELRHFRQLGSVLYAAAHPDDENTQLLAWLSRGQGYRTADLSLTRGDGGQNVIGPELGDKLGVARTQELLAGRRLDGARQYFSRALDFGFSKDYADTQRVWGRDEVIGDIVRVIRRFQPDVILTRFSPQPGGTHGHHTASAVLSIEAFKLAGDPKAYPEQIAQGLKPWQPKRILQNGSFGRGAPAAGSLPVEIGGDDPVLGIPLSTLSLRILAQHKTQNLGGVIFGQGRGAGVGSGPRTETFSLLGGEAPATGLFDGVATTWTDRYPGPGAEIDALAAAALEKFDEKNLSANVPALLALRAKLAALPADPLVTDKRAQLDRVLQACLGLRVATTVATPDAVPGETLALTHTVSSSVPVRWLATRTADGQSLTAASAVTAKTETQSSKFLLPATTPLTTPYWLRAEGRPGLARVDDPALIGNAENFPPVPLDYVFEINGQQLVIADEPFSVSGTGPTEKRRRLDVVPAVSLGFTTDVTVYAPGATRTVEVEVSANRPGSAGTLALELPAGWKATPAAQPFALTAAGAKSRLSFTVTAPATPASATFGAVATIKGAAYRTARDEVNYAHIPPQLLQPPARQRAVALDVAVAAKKIGFLPGAGDDIPAALAQLGCTVTTLTGADLNAAKLATLDTVVIGVRAFNTRDDLAANLPALFAWVEAGGTVVAQYNRPGRDIKTDRLAPYALTLGGNDARVTDEDAAITLLEPTHPAFNSPNKLTAADWSGWVQERGAYFGTTWGDEFKPLLACNDAGEAPQKGALLVARHGKGYYVYTGLGFFRQLPAGVPGAYRLFANLISLGR